MPYKDAATRREYYRLREAEKRQRRIAAGLNSKGTERRPHFIPTRAPQAPIGRTDAELDQQALVWLERIHGNLLG